MTIRSHLAPLSVFFGACLTLAVVLVALAAKSWRHRRHLAAVPIRIHVAGTRGKSTTVRLVASALRAKGLRVVAKTTGTRPRLIRPDGTDEAWPRRGPASVREQLRFFARAAAERADAVVVECMAIRPELIAASERHLVRATTVIVTNARADHGEDLTNERDAMAASLVHAVPRAGRLVISDEIDAAGFHAHAARLGTIVTTVATGDADPLDANIRLAAFVAETHGVPPGALQEAFATALPDPGAFTLRRIAIAGRGLIFANAFACNDVDSFERLWRARSSPQPATILFNARSDRPMRTHAFLASLARLQPQPRVFLAGGGRRLLALARRAGLAPETASLLTTREPSRVLALLAAGAEDGAQIWGVGNYRGLGDALVAHLDAAQPC